MAFKFWPKLSRLGYAQKWMKLGKDSLGCPKENNSNSLTKVNTFIRSTAPSKGGGASTEGRSAQYDGTYCKDW